MQFVASFAEHKISKTGSSSHLASLASWLPGSWREHASPGRLKLWLPNHEQEDIHERKFGALGDRGYFLIGLAFRKSNEEEDHDLDLSADEFQQVMRSNGSFLCDHFWGQYIFIGYDLEAEKYLIIRDPTGMVPCYESAKMGGHIFFSDLGVLPDFYAPHSLDYSFLKATATGSAFDRVGSGLQGISEIHAGASTMVSRNETSRHQCWNPYSFVARASKQSFDETSQSVRFTIRKVVRTLARRFNNVAVALGGLDSSVVASCLSNLTHSCAVQTFTYATEGRGGDEYYYSKSVADFLGHPIDKYTLRSDNIDFDFVMAGNGQPKPDRVFEFGDLAAQPDMDKYKDIQALFTGAGGDSLFLQSPDILPVVDWLGSKTSPLHLLNIIRNAVNEGQRPPWYFMSALLSAWRKQELAPAIIDAKVGGIANEQWLSREGVEASLDRNFINPALLHDGLVPQAKISQIMNNCCTPLRPFSPLNYFSHVPNFHIYLLQPIVELCLSIPTSQFSFQGVDRGLLRHAFRNDLPEKLLRRITKSSPGRIYAEFIESNADRIIGHLCSGVCDQMQIMSDSFRENLSSKQSIRSLSSTNVLGLLNIESWSKNYI